jgi:hypothetical protein
MVMDSQASSIKKCVLCCGLEKSLSERHGHGVAQNGMCESNTAALCKSNGKNTI